MDTLVDGPWTAGRAASVAGFALSDAIASLDNFCEYDGASRKQTFMGHPRGCFADLLILSSPVFYPNIHLFVWRCTLKLWIKGVE